MLEHHARNENGRKQIERTPEETNQRDETRDEMGWERNHKSHASSSAPFPLVRHRAWVLVIFVLGC